MPWWLLLLMGKPYRGQTADGSTLVIYAPKPKGQFGYTLKKADDKRASAARLLSLNSPALALAQALGCEVADLPPGAVDHLNSSVQSSATDDQRSHGASSAATQMEVDEDADADAEPAERLGAAVPFSLDAIGSCACTACGEDATLVLLDCRDLCASCAEDNLELGRSSQ